MSATARISLWVRKYLQRIQSKLSFDSWGAYPQFSTTKGLGRVAMAACVLGMLWGIHVSVILLIGLQHMGTVDLQGLLEPDRVQLLLQWCLYVVTLCTFHLLEFFVTAVCNPTVTTYDSFLINQSVAYTAAALTSWTEFWIRFWFLPGANSRYIMMVGLVVVSLAQIVRSMAMVTCGESFNHLIQRSKEENHVLVTNGIYKVLRHPSYVGFYYWAVGTQLLLGNVLHALLFSIAAWSFFNRRIPYEEECLVHLFPNEYPDYVARTWSGIPFITTRIQTR